MKKLPELFLTFAKIGLFTFGGGYAMIPLIESTCVERKGWITHDEMMNVTVVAESTPGPIAINAATFVGYRRAGLPGAIAATLGVVLPSFLIIIPVALFFDNFLELTLVANAFKGVKIAVGLLILDAGIGMLRKMSKKTFPRLIMLGAFAAMLCIDLFAWSFSSMLLLLIAATAGLVFYALGGRTEEKTEGAPKKGGGAA